MAGVVTYYAYDMGLPAVSPVPTLIAELPFVNVTFSSLLNTPGPFVGTLLLSDPRVALLDANNATRPARTLLIVDVDGVIQWGGIIWTRAYSASTHQVQVGGMEAWSYFQQRVQAADYSVPPTDNAFSTNPATYWSANPVDLAHAAAQVVLDACSASGSIFTGFVTTSPGLPNSGAIYIDLEGGTPSPLTVTLPLLQRSSIDSIVTTFAQSGYGTGFDFGIDWTWSGAQGSTPVPTLNISFPRRGRPAGSTGLTIDAATASDWTWPEDATQMFNTIYGSASGSGGLSVVESDPTPLTDGYPLLENNQSYSNLVTTAQLQAAILDDLALTEWPVTTPVFTIPMLGDPTVGEFLMGDDVRVIMEPNERFPAGFDTYLRIVGQDVHPGDEGVSTMDVTLGQVPGVAPVPPPPI